MSLLQPFSKNKTEKQIKSELGLIFGDILIKDGQSKRRRLNLIRLNMLGALDDKRMVRSKTKKIFEEFQIFLNRFEK